MKFNTTDIQHLHISFVTNLHEQEKHLPPGRWLVSLMATDAEHLMDLLPFLGLSTGLPDHAQVAHAVLVHQEGVARFQAPLPAQGAAEAGRGLLRPDLGVGRVGGEVAPD